MSETAVVTKPKERPIIFSSNMIKAILEGCKTQTRRIAKDPARSIWLDGMWTACPYGVTGDRLWVRETWGDLDADLPRVKDGRRPTMGDRIVYRADPDMDYQWSNAPTSVFSWRPSLLMPRWASRIILEITGIRVERLHEITEADAKAEGLTAGGREIGCAPHLYEGDEDMRDLDHVNQTDEMFMWIDGFRTLWNSINDTRGFGWDTNPWVWVIEFKRVNP